VIDNGKALLEKKKNTEESEDDKSDKKAKKSRKKKNSLASGEGLSACIEQLVNDSGIAEYHREDDEIAGNNRINNLQELLNTASKYQSSREGLLNFLEDIELDRSMKDILTADDQQNAVTLITFHNTKGLEFKRVIMTGLEQGVFPREDKKGEELEEERRLFYVGATRAMDELYLTTCKERRMYGKTETNMQPSLFLRELDRNSLQIDDRRASFTLPRRSFNPYVLNNAAAGKKSELEERSDWRRGQRIFHEDNGYGAVMEVRDSDDGPVVRVRFDSGKETRFLSEYQGRKFEKIGDDC